MSLQVPPFFPADTGEDVITNNDFKPGSVTVPGVGEAPDTERVETEAEYTTRIMEVFEDAGRSVQGLNSILSLFQPFRECFIDQNRKFHTSEDLVLFHLKAIYKNAKDFGMYTHVFADGG